MNIINELTELVQEFTKYKERVCVLEMERDALRKKLDDFEQLLLTKDKLIQAIKDEPRGDEALLLILKRIENKVNDLGNDKKLEKLWFVQRT